MKNLNKGAILLLSGPSGCGKSSLLNELYKHIDNYYFSISTTTGKPRAGETHGVEYFFVSKEQFLKDIDANNFLEWAQVHGNYYGTSLIPIQKALNNNKLIIFDIDVQGFEQVIKEFRDITTTIFITTPSLNELKNRLLNRGTDNNDIINKRIANAKDEIKYINRYDYIIVNDNFQNAALQLLSVAITAKIKTTLFKNSDLAHNWIEF